MVGQSLCLAFQQASHLRPLVNSIAGVILMGTPHSRHEGDAVWNSAQLLLKPRGRFRSKHPIEKEDALLLAHLSSQFEDLASDLHIFSVYETETTKLKASLISSKHLVMLIVIFSYVAASRNS